MLFWLIENKEQLTKFFNRGYKEVFVEIIPYNNFQHPKENKVCGVYIRPLKGKKGFIFPISHTETINLKEESIPKILKSFDKIYVRDKKEFLHYFICKNIYDVTLSQSYMLEHTITHNYFYNKFPNKKDINRIIPITKHYEYCENLFEKLEPNINEEINLFFNNKSSMVFNLIEQSGIRIQREEFEKHFHEVESDFVYTQYNFKTLTKRPSNKFDKVNFAALDKKNGCRKSIIPRNDLLVEFDISSYHPTMLAKFIGHRFESNDIHGEFAEMYGVDYQESKFITFRQIYGGVYDKYKELPFFKKVIEYTNSLWEQYNTQGYIEDEISKYRFEKDKLVDMNPQKLLNYKLQHRETVNNVNILWEILPLLLKTKTKIIMYSYDAILCDFHKSEKHLIKQIQDVFKKYELHTKINIGKNYHEMKEVFM